MDLIDYLAFKTGTKLCIELLFDRINNLPSLLILLFFRRVQYQVQQDPQLGEPQRNLLVCMGLCVSSLGAGVALALGQYRRKGRCTRRYQHGSCQTWPQ